MSSEQKEPFQRNSATYAARDNEPLKTQKDAGLLFKDESYAIRGAAFEVYREMGCDFLEAVYQECLRKEFTKRGMPFLEQVGLQLSYKGEPLDRKVYVLIRDSVSVTYHAWLEFLVSKEIFNH